MARFKLTGVDDSLGINLGNVTFAAMTNLETDEKAGDVVEKEEDEEEVYGIFTGKNIRENM